MIDPRDPDYTNTPACSRRPAFAYAPLDRAAKPCVTVVTPFHDAQEVFRETADSVLRQSLQQWEWLIVNDASSDPAALAMLDEYRSRDPRISVIDNAENQGLAATRNVGVAAATSAYVFFLDDDDLIEPTALEKMAWLLESHPEPAVANSWSVGFGAQQYLWSIGFDRGDEFLQENLITAQAMVRRSAHQTVGGYDASIRTGMEDWDYWLRLADRGFWGATIPEYLAWYRRREHHGDRWQGLDSEDARHAFRDKLRERYPRLYAGEFPKIAPQPEPVCVREHLPFANSLDKTKQRLLVIAPWLGADAADEFNLSMVEQLAGLGWEVTLAVTSRADNSSLPEFARHTPDVFVLHEFLKPVDRPLFLRYLIQSRRPDVVMVARSELGYLLLPYLRACCPEPSYVDCHHIESGGGHADYGVLMQNYLDLNIVTSEQTARRMTAAGADAARIVELMGPDETAESVEPAFARARQLREESPRSAVDEQAAKASAARAVAHLRVADQAVPDSHRRIEELEEGKVRLETEWRRCQEQLAERTSTLEAEIQREAAECVRLRAACADWKGQPLFRILRRAGLLRDLTFD